MWLLKLHFSISILSLIFCLGFSKLFREQILENGYKIPIKAKELYTFFVPFMNIFNIFAVCIMIFMKKEEFEKKIKEEKEN